MVTLSSLINFIIILWILYELSGQTDAMEDLTTSASTNNDTIPTCGDTWIVIQHIMPTRES